MRTIASAFLILIVVLGATPPALAQSASVDPGSLIGEWRGTMMLRGSSRGRGGVRGGDYALIISSVEGNVVRGRIVGPDESSSGKLEGTLEKDTLHFAGGGGSKTQMTIKGDSMEGVRTGSGGQGGGRNEWTLNLSKRK